MMDFQVTSTYSSCDPSFYLAILCVKSALLPFNAFVLFPLNPGPIRVMEKPDVRDETID